MHGYIRYYPTIILWARPFALSGIIRNYDGEFPSKIARTLFHPNNMIDISHVGRMIIRPSNESGRSRTIDIYVRCFSDSRPRRTLFHTTPGTAENNAQGTWLCLRFLCSIIHSSIPGCHLIGEYSATDIARGISEKTSSDWLIRWGFISIVILVPGISGSWVDENIIV